MKKNSSALVIVFIIMLPAACYAGKKGGIPMPLQITSSAFADGSPVPSQYTCDGQDKSPPLNWDAPPAGCKSLALICDDPDAPGKTWVHWVCYDIPPQVKGIAEGCSKSDTIPGGGKQGMTDFGSLGYGGPCPPSGVHRYLFKLYALDSMLNLPAGKTKKQVEAAMQGHILTRGQLVGTYTRKR
jgi:Raf kinase inhibitor-like YbhB/YbcL family protein